MSTQNVQANDATLELRTFPAPPGFALRLTSLKIHAAPGAAQNITTQSIQIARTDLEPVVVLLGQTQPIAANTKQDLHWQGEQWITPGMLVRFVAEFNAGVALNVLEGNMFGIIIPLGNIERP